MSKTKNKKHQNSATSPARLWRRLSLIITSAGLVVLLAMLIVALMAPAEEPAARVNVGGDFTLVDQNGITRTQADFADKYTLIYFGFTYCPDVCPTALDVMGRAMEIVAQTAPDKAATIQPLFISVDPARDTVEALADYVTYFHPRLIGLTGSPAQIKQALQKYKVYAARVATPEEGADSYTMDHSSLFYLMDQQNRFVHHFDHTKAPEDMAADLLKFVR
jgi:protein SCO1/2